MTIKGSDKYPRYGQLKRLATTCLTSPVNATTWTDKTSYYVSSASPSGICDVLEVMLDHVLHPRMDQSVMDFEVFSLKKNARSGGEAESVSGQGVVFVEMKAKEQLEGVIHSRALSRALVTKHHDIVGEAMDAYHWVSGGLIGDIATITRDDLLRFHRKHYHPEKVIVHVSGPIGDGEIDGLLTAVAATLRPATAYAIGEREGGERSVRRAFAPIPTDPGLSSVTVPFVASKTTQGHVYLAWCFGDAYSLEQDATHTVLFQALMSSKTALLSRAFLDTNPPWATSVSYHNTSMVAMTHRVLFSNVPFDVNHNGMTPGRLSAVWREAIAGILDKEPSTLMEAISRALTAYELELERQFESKPHDAVFDYSVQLWVNARLTGATELPFGAHIMNLRRHLHALHSEGVEFWREKLRRFLDAEPLKVLATPDAGLRVKVQEEEKMAMQQVWASGQGRVVDLKEPESEESREPFSLRADYRLLRAVTAVRMGHRVFEMESARSRALEMLVSTERLLPPRLWPLLPLYHRMLQCSDVDFAADLELHGKMGFAADGTAGSTTLVSAERFIAALDSVFLGYSFDLRTRCIKMQLPEDSPLTLGDGARLLRQVLLTGAQFEQRGVESELARIKSAVGARRRDPVAILNTLLALRLRAAFLAEDRGETQLFVLAASPFRPVVDDATTAHQQLTEMQRLLRTEQSTTDTTITVGGREQAMERELAMLPIGSAGSGPDRYYPRYGQLQFARSEAVLYQSNEATGTR